MSVGRTPDIAARKAKAEDHPRHYNHAMPDEQTTIAVQRYLDELADLQADSPCEPLVRALLERAVGRLKMLCSVLLSRSYPRLMRPPLNLESDEMLGAVTARLLGAMREVKPGSVRQFFALANQHIRWELNDLARRMDAQPPDGQLNEAFVAAADNSDSELGSNARRILEAIDRLPDAEREVFELVRIQGLPQVEVAELLGVASKTIQRRLNRSLLLLSEELRDLRPHDGKIEL
jgi:RNA polymerase sigma-70 factor (ECF subfamily)